jgi:hypothetical protein
MGLRIEGPGTGPFFISSLPGGTPRLLPLRPVHPALPRQSRFFAVYFQYLL